MSNLMGSETKEPTNAHAHQDDDGVVDNSYQNEALFDKSSKDSSSQGNSSSLRRLQIDTDDEEGLGDGIDNEEATYFGLICYNRPYRLFLSSYLVARAGDWFNYVACITAIEDIIGPDSESSMTAISVLVIVRLLPDVLLSSVGGALADARDRRICMIALDCSGAAVVLLYLAAYRLKSISLIYIVSFILESIAALYEPNKTAVVPLLVQNEEYLKKAMTLSVLAWSAMAAVGAGLGGFAVSLLGIQACFVIDSISFGFSAFLLWRIGGSWTVANTKEQLRYESLWSQFIQMTLEGASYLSSSEFAPYVFLKCSAALVFGAADVLNVAFAQRSGNGNASSSELVGLLFTSVGIGCLIGPLVADRLTDMKEPQSLLKACVLSLALLAIGYFGMGCFAPLASLCFFTAVRAAGSAVAWVDSTLLLQKFSVPEMLGRVTAVEYSLATMGEAASALLAGILQDDCGLTAEGASFAMAALGALLFVVWLPLLQGKGVSAMAAADINGQSENQPLLP